MQEYYFKGYRILNPVTFFSNQVVLENETITLDVSRLVLPAQRWELTFKLITNGAEADLFNTLTVDRYSAGTMVMPQQPNAAARVTFAGSATVQSSTLAGNDTVAVLPTGSGLLPKGSFIQFAGHKKVYMVKADANLVDQQATNVAVFPNLIGDLDAAIDVNFGDDVTFNYLIDDTVVSGLTFVQGKLSDVGAIRLLEVRR